MSNFVVAIKWLIMAFVGSLWFFSWSLNSHESRDREAKAALRRRRACRADAMSTPLASRRFRALVRRTRIKKKKRATSIDLTSPRNDFRFPPRFVKRLERTRDVAPDDSNQRPRRLERCGSIAKKNTNKNKINDCLFCVKETKQHETYLQQRARLDSNRENARRNRLQQQTQLPASIASSENLNCERDTCRHRW